MLKCEITRDRTNGFQALQGLVCLGASPSHCSDSLYEPSLMENLDRGMNPSARTKQAPSPPGYRAVLALYMKKK